MPGRPRDDGHQDDGGPVYVDEHHQAISEFAAAYLDDDEREQFVDHLMERNGYERISGWGPRRDPDPEPEPEPGPAPGRGPSSSARGGRGQPKYFKR